MSANSDLIAKLRARVRRCKALGQTQTGINVQDLEALLGGGMKPSLAGPAMDCATGLPKHHARSAVYLATTATTKRRQKQS